MPSRTTVIETAGFARASASNAPLVSGSHAFGGGPTATVVLVDDVRVVLVVLEVVVLDVVDVEVVVLGGVVVVVVVTATSVAARASAVGVVELVQAALDNSRTMAVSTPTGNDTGIRGVVRVPTVRS
jgi:hypothetical protein